MQEMYTNKISFQIQFQKNHKFIHNLSKNFIFLHNFLKCKQRPLADTLEKTFFLKVQCMQFFHWAYILVVCLLNSLLQQRGCNRVHEGSDPPAAQKECFENALEDPL